MSNENPFNKMIQSHKDLLKYMEDIGIDKLDRASYQFYKVTKINIERYERTKKEGA